MGGGVKALRGLGMQWQFFRRTESSVCYCVPEDCWSVGKKGGKEISTRYRLCKCTTTAQKSMLKKRKYYFAPPNSFFKPLHSQILSIFTLSHKMVII